LWIEVFESADVAAPGRPRATLFRALRVRAPVAPAFTRPRGTRDFGPDEMERRRAVEAQLRSVAARFGYREVATPTFEHLELFTTKSGEGVVKQLYAFKDKGDRDLTLRPELTAPVLRFYVGELSTQPKPLKLFYFGNCFRYEEPQSGRYREFWQVGTELIGPETPEAAAETIALAQSCFRAAGLANLELRVGHIGVLKSVARALGMTDADRQQLFALVDKREVARKQELAQAILAKYAQGKDLVHWMALLTDLGSGEATREDVLEGHGPLIGQHAELQTALDALGATFQFLQALGVQGAKEDLGVVRGLDYYTGVVFEFHSPDLGAESQVCGGGVYALAETLGGEPVGSTGFAIGFDRTLLALERGGLGPAPARKLSAYVVPIGEPARARALAVAAELRSKGLAVDVDLMRRGPSKCLDYANAVGARAVVLLGSKELERGVATVKDMASGQQREVPLATLADELS
jgi:histidyl-tRNA synthetase